MCPPFGLFSGSVLETKMDVFSAEKKSSNASILQSTFLYLIYQGNSTARRLYQILSEFSLSPETLQGILRPLRASKKCVKAYIC